MMEYLAHHGTKGMKWGVRRYQNADGSLTDEGRRRYGYGKDASRLITKNTTSRMKTGAKIGATVGAGVGLAAGTVGAALVAPYWGVPTAAAYALGTAFGTSIRGTLEGTAIGGIVGAVETHKGRDYIERYDRGLASFEKREGMRSKKVHNVRISS